MDLVERKRNNKEIVSTWHSRSRDKWPDLQFPLSLQFAPVAKVRWVWTKLTFSKYHNCPTTGIWSIIVLPASPVGSSLPKAPCKKHYRAKTNIEAKPQHYETKCKTVQGIKAKARKSPYHDLSFNGTRRNTVHSNALPEWIMNISENNEKLI